MREVVRAWWLALGTVAVACAGSGESDADRLQPFDPTGSTFCTSDADCCPEGSVCPAVTCVHYQGSMGDERSICTKPCTVNADCTSDLDVSLACGVLDDGTRNCLEACVGNASPPAIACVSGVPTTCAAAGETHCAICGCSAGQRCEDGVGCFAQRAVGETCEDDADCTSAHCSEVSHVCRVPVGAACNDQNCDMCMTGANGWSFCSRYCHSALTSCGETAICKVIGPGASAKRLCWPRCTGIDDSSCPVACTAFPNLVGGQDYACGCTDDACTFTGPARALGALCDNAAQCQSGDCRTRLLECDSICSPVGYCSQACTSTTDCGPGFHCVNSACAPGCESEADCPVPSCRTATNAEGDTVSACDLGRAASESCAEGLDCNSGTCCSGVCDRC